MINEIVAQTLANGTLAESFVHSAYAPALATHIGAGVVSILSGAAALNFSKGDARHRVAGQAIVLGMLLIGLSGPFIAKSHVAMLTPIIADYFVITGWRSIRRTTQEGSNLFEIIALCVVVCLAATYVMLGQQAAASASGSLDGFPASFHYVFAGLALAAAAMDLNVIARGRVVGAARLSRHLGRMCFGLLLAGMSFFLGQRDRFPVEVRRTGILLFITLAPLAIMLFWLVRVHFMPNARFHPALEFAGRTLCAAYFAVTAIGLLALFRPRGI